MGYDYAPLVIAAKEKQIGELQEQLFDLRRQLAEAQAKIDAVPLGAIYQLIALSSFENRCVADAKAASAWIGTLAETANR